MTIREIEEDLRSKGYSLSISTIFDDSDKAKTYAKNLRNLGYRARVIKYSSRIPGLCDYGVWRTYTVKEKEK